jgi:hypothetical protein
MNDNTEISENIPVETKQAMQRTELWELIIPLYPHRSIASVRVLHNFHASMILRTSIISCQARLILAYDSQLLIYLMKRE